VNDPLAPQEESLATRRARVLARMAASRSALRADSHAERSIGVPLSSQSRTPFVAPVARSSPLHALFTSPNAQIFAALLIGFVILSPRRVIIAAALPLLRVVIGRAVRDLAVR
jgi:hypothetical protein